MKHPEDETAPELSLSDIELTHAQGGGSEGHAPTPAAPPLTTAPRVGRYELLLELASGGMATVYIGRQFGAGGFQRLVAIKRMHPHVARMPELAASFMDEARIASLIRHANVVNVHDVHETDGEHLLVMDYVEGASLASVMRAARKRGERISRPAALRIVIEALHGLHAAHEQCSLDGRPLGIVHRDATPHNILLGVDGSVRLTDFGIAKAADRNVNTATGLAKGKFRYMAPEQARGGALDRRVDVFAMGIVAWELLTGERLFDGESDSQALLAIAAGNYRTTRSVDASIPAELDALVMRALGKDPNERYASAQAFAAALAEWVQRAAESTSPTDVARLVHEFCGPEIEQRRGKLTHVLAGRTAPPRVRDSLASHPGEAPSSPGTSAPITLDSVKVVPALTSAQLAAEQARARRVRGLVAGAGALGVLGVIALIVWLRAPAPAEPHASSTVVVTASAPAAPPSAAPESSRVRITIRADQAVNEVRGKGVSEIEFTSDGVVLQLPRSSQATQLTIVLGDGSEVEEEVLPKENVSLRVRSVAAQPKAATTRAAPPAAATSKARPKPAATLEDNPYE